MNKDLVFFANCTLFKAPQHLLLLYEILAKTTLNPTDFKNIFRCPKWLCKFPALTHIKLPSVWAVLQTSLGNWWTFFAMLSISKNWHMWNWIFFIMESELPTTHLTKCHAKSTHNRFSARGLQVCTGSQKVWILKKNQLRTTDQTHSRVRMKWKSQDPTHNQTRITSTHSSLVSHMHATDHTRWPKTRWRL